MTSPDSSPGMDQSSLQVPKLPEATALFTYDGRELRPATDGLSVIDGLYIADPPRSPTREELQALSLEHDKRNGRLIITIPELK